MVLMENGRMDLKCDLSTESDRFIVVSGKGIKSCYDADSTISFQNIDNGKSLANSKVVPILGNNFKNCTGGVIVDNSQSSQSAYIVNGDDHSVTHESRSVDILMTNSSQCNINSQIPYCAIVENELSSLSLADHESIMKSEEVKVCNSESYDVISPETATDQRTADGINGAFTEILPSDSEVIIDPNSNISCRIEEQENASEITYISYESENQMPDIMKLIQKDLSEPYSIYTYRYFIHNWPHLCFLVIHFNFLIYFLFCIFFSIKINFTLHIDVFAGSEQRKERGSNCL